MHPGRANNTAKHNVLHTRLSGGEAGLTDMSTLFRTTRGREGKGEDGERGEEGGKEKKGKGERKGERRGRGKGKGRERKERKEGKEKKGGGRDRSWGKGKKVSGENGREQERVGRE